MPIALLLGIGFRPAAADLAQLRSGTGLSKSVRLVACEYPADKIGDPFLPGFLLAEASKQHGALPSDPTKVEQRSVEVLGKPAIVVYFA